MTKMQNWRLRGCISVLLDQNDKLTTMSQNYANANLPNIMLKNIRDNLEIAVALLDQVGHINIDAEISDEYIARLRHSIGDLAVSVAMTEIQINEYRKRA
jgi:hypothetical protein